MACTILSSGLVRAREQNISHIPLCVCSICLLEIGAILYRVSFGSPESEIFWHGIFNKVTISVEILSWSTYTIQANLEPRV